MLLPPLNTLSKFGLDPVLAPVSSFLIAQLNSGDIETSVQSLLNSHYTMLALRKGAYLWILDQSHVFREIMTSTTETSLFDVGYCCILAFTMGFFLKDRSYQKSTARIVKRNAVSATGKVRFIEGVILFLTMVLFQNIDNVT